HLKEAKVGTGYSSVLSRLAPAIHHCFTSWQLLNTVQRTSDPFADGGPKTSRKILKATRSLHGQL
ncbi:hypothetical protein HAX54_014497, partial [Datura stramonium]|nr:hypothetical protein [Datura stramonium]